MPLVYVIDDSPTDRSLIVRFLNRHVPGVEVVCETDGYHALQSLTEISEDPSRTAPKLVILDQRMPRINGDELLVRVRHLPRLISVPFVLFSSSALEEDILACTTSGSSSYVRKPLEFKEFERVVKGMADYWLTIHGGDTIFSRTGAGLR